MIRRMSTLGLVLGLLAPALAAQDGPPRGVTIAALAHQALVRSALDDLLPPERSVSQIGLEVGAPTFWRPLRLSARVLQGSGGSDDLRSLEASLVVSGRYIAVEAGYGERASYSPQTGLAHGRPANFARAGLRAQLALGGTGFSLHLRGAGYVPTAAPPDRDDALEGWDAESGLRWQGTSFPVSATLGYRLERFRIFGVEQEVSALTFALGFTLLDR